MTQKRRGLGRGLQALIPEAQAENPAQRPSDVFFPRTQAVRDGADDLLAPRSADAASAHAAEIASTLLAPSKRATSARKTAKGAKAARRTAADPAAAVDVSRETSVGEGQGSAAGASAEDDGVLAAPAGRDRLAESGEDRVAAADAGLEGSGDVSRETSQDGSGSGLVPVPGATFAELPVELISPNPRQPRQVFDEDDIAELAASIKEVGLLQPIVVRRVDGDAPGDVSGSAAAVVEQHELRYELIMGERRLRASKEAGLKTIPAVVRYTEDDALLRDALLENLHRVQLNPLEEAAAYQQLLEDFGCTHAELSEKIARSRSQISNTLRLMKLPALVQRRVAAGVLSAGHARALLGLPDAASMERLAQRIVAEGLSVRATEELVALHDEPDEAPAKRSTRARAQALPVLSGRLSDVFDTRVKVTRGAKKGKITIEFAGEEDLARIVAALAPGTEVDE